jgi:hypothetical protein
VNYLSYYLNYHPSNFPVLPRSIYLWDYNRSHPHALGACAVFYSIYILSTFFSVLIPVLVKVRRVKIDKPYDHRFTWVVPDARSRDLHLRKFLPSQYEHLCLKRLKVFLNQVESEQRKEGMRAGSEQEMGDMRVMPNGCYLCERILMVLNQIIRQKT